MSIPTTLHLDLRQTTLEDFAEHFQHAVADAVRWGGHGAQGTLMWESSKTAGGQMGYIVGVDGEGYTVRVHHSLLGSTGHTWLCRWSGGRGQDLGGFILGAQRFSTDRIKVFLRELQDQPIYAPHLSEWLKRRWADELIDELPLKGAPQEPTEKSPGNPASRDTINRLHHLLKTTTTSARKLLQQEHTHRDSYYRLCESYTEEKPFDLMARHQKILRHQWPPED